MPILKDKSVWDLPAKPDTNGGDEVLTAFMTDRHAVQTPEQLIEFVKKWKNVWLFKEKKEDTFCSVVEEKLLNLSFDPVEILKCFELNKKSKCDRVDCPCSYIMIPTALLKASILAHHFVVPQDIALIQMSAGVGFPPRW